MFCCVGQTHPRLGEPGRNLERVLERLEEATAAGCELAVLPECAIPGYMFDSREDATRVAEEIPGPSTEALERACARLGLHCVVGLLERDGDLIRNTAVLVGPGGLVGLYRKAHLPYLGVDRFVAPGDEAPEVFETPLGRIGIQICYDLRFPELTRSLALRGAELVAHPTNWPAAVRPLGDFMTRARAAENRVYLLTANRVGTEAGATFFGWSQIVDPLGVRLAECDAESVSLAVAEVDPAAAREKNRVIVPGEYELHLFDDRRPELYEAVVAETHTIHAD